MKARITMEGDVRLFAECREDTEILDRFVAASSVDTAYRAPAAVVAMQRGSQKGNVTEITIAPSRAVPEAEAEESGGPKGGTLHIRIETGSPKEIAEQFRKVAAGFIETAEGIEERGGA